MDYNKDFERFLREDDLYVKTMKRVLRGMDKAKPEGDEYRLEDTSDIVTFMLFSSYMQEQKKENPLVAEDEELQAFFKEWWKEHITGNKRLKFSFTKGMNCKVTLREPSVNGSGKV